MPVWALRPAQRARAARRAIRPSLAREPTPSPLRPRDARRLWRGALLAIVGDERLHPCEPDGCDQEGQQDRLGNRSPVFDHAPMGKQRGCQSPVLRKHITCRILSRRAGAKLIGLTGARLIEAGARLTARVSRTLTGSRL